MWIKICGITSTENAQMVANSGVDAIGLNFFPRSKRFVSTVDAAALRQAAINVEAVGVFVNHSPTDIAEIVQAVQLTAVQFHGDETAETIREFHGMSPETEIIRAVRIGSDSPDRLRTVTDSLKDLHVPLKAVLVDAYVPGEYGGTGERVEPAWLKERDESVPLILAGGLKPENVSEAIATIEPWGVDTASGVETAPGIKDLTKVATFVRAAREHG